MLRLMWGCGSQGITKNVLFLCVIFIMLMMEVDCCLMHVLHYVEFCAYVTELDYLDYHKT